MSRPGIAEIIAVSILLISSQRAFAAQCSVSWNCGGSAQCAQVYGGASSGSRPVASCAGFVQRDQVSRCSCDGVASSGEPRFVTPPAAVIAGHAVGGLSGALLGSFFQSPNGQSFWAEGAAEGAGAVGLAVLAANADKFSTPAVVAVAALDGALIGGGYGHYRSVALIPQGATPTDEVQQTATGAAVGAAAAAVVTFAVLTLTSSDKLQSIPSNFRFDVTPRRLGLSVSW